MGQQLLRFPTCYVQHVTYSHEAHRSPRTGHFHAGAGEVEPKPLRISILLYRFEQQQNNPERLFYHLKNVISATSTDYLHD